jgi:tRNA-specific 2-thiouridylase
MLHKKIAVGMSGGIDSTMTAYLLKEMGYEVVGLTMKIWDGSVACEAVRSGCYGPGEASDIEDAKKAAARLRIDHFVIDVCGEYEETVLNYFSTEYTEGRTPNPCIMCNAKIKFGSLIEKARLSGIPFNLFATGHYARIRRDAASGRYTLLRGLDELKDQSYFLHRLSQDQLSQVLFPLGEYRKEEVKSLALKAGFDEYLDKRESQDFLEFTDYAFLLKEPHWPGNIVDTAGNVIGRHRGIAFYTVGQRRALGLAGMKEPYYVLHIDAAKNEIIAGPKAGLMNDGLRAENMNWIIPLNDWPEGPVTAKIRSTAVPAPCTIGFRTDTSAAVYFDAPQESITRGQSVVFYCSEIVLGGGTITGPFNKQLG